ncbi:MAG TPA: pyruvate dehydrogenase complex dihydrolipoamide acetyltransferase [Pyrinomonadaceae bacterium]|jgi:pyruvate dehydrogenase E2 component (dihydrolipoamide acetyltransferase)|nr:pyruvate dehydrogenase complex dihydrolipoamide acetyltransferase [Pyrinomonadaceae bacterium]
MATQVIMPKLSPTMEEGQLSRWLKKEGDKVSMGEPLAEIDTDKATMEMQALGNGVLRKIFIQEGESAPLGQLIAIIGEPDEDISAISNPAPTSAPAKPAASSEPQTAVDSDEKEAEPAKPATEKPAVAEPPAAGNGRQAPAPVAQAPSGRLIVSPLAARMAAESGIDLRSVNGSGPGGRIIKRDVEGLIGQQGSTAPSAGAKQTHLRAVTTPIQQSAITAASAYRDEPASEMRRTIAKRLVTSLGPVPHFFLTTEIEMDRAAEMRTGINELDPELKISINDIIIKVAAAALLQHPQVNASYQDKAVRYYEHADIGVAVAIEDGLITPIIRAADQKSLSEIAGEVRELAGRARERKLKPEEFMGATFSISNLGMFGIDEFTAVINPPEGAILAIGAMSPKPVVRDNEVVVRQMMRVTMSCDHRVIDGATGAKFLQTFKKILENPLFLVV